MSNRAVPKLSKWPFFLGDFCLVALAVAVIFRNPAPLTFGEGALGVTAILAAVCLGVWPFLKEYQAAVRLSEADALATTVSEIAKLDQIKNQIASFTSQWQSAQQQSSQTVAQAKELTDRIKAERSEFAAFLQKASDTERNHLRLEVEKLRRGEREWLQATVHMLDHVFALQSAGARSGQPALATQLGQFQHACRDAVRRLGLTGFAPSPGEPFDAQRHQVGDAETTPDSGARVVEILASGYTLRGELVRRALVKVEGGLVAEQEPAADSVGAETADSVGASA